MVENVQTGGDAALQPPTINTSPDERYAADRRLWQGIPGIERAADGRLWAVWYSGGKTEGPENVVLLATSRDDGATWREPVAVIDPPGNVRAYDPCLWHDPLGRLWLFWAQSDGWFDGRCGVWAAVAENAGDADPTWSDPRRLWHGIAMNKPTVLSTGEWMLPAAIWSHDEPKREDMAALRGSSVIVSEDQGATWARRSGAHVPESKYDEHMVVERNDGTLWMLVRTTYGIGESFSEDRGATWTPGEPSDIEGPGSRFHIRRLQSGRLLLINHYRFTKRSHMTARLSDDDGRTWNDGLLLDERASVSYPDAVQAPDGLIYAIYDYNRYAEREILMATFREEDVDEGCPVSADTRLKHVVNRATAPREDA